MENLRHKLKNKVYGLMNKKDITDIINIILREYNLEDYVSTISFSFEEFNGLSNENPIDYDYITPTLSINVPSLHKDFIELKYMDSYVYNWMILIYNILYAIEEINLYKLKENEEECKENKILKLYYEYQNKTNFIRKHKFLSKYKESEKIDASNVIIPEERIKMVNAYFKTIDIFKDLNIKTEAIDWFVQTHINQILNGYNEQDRNIYPLQSIFYQKSYLEGKYYMNKFKWYNNEPMMTLSNAADDTNDVKKRLSYGMPIDTYEFILTRRNKV